MELVALVSVGHINISGLEVLIPIIIAEKHKFCKLDILDYLFKLS